MRRHHVRVRDIRVDPARERDDREHVARVGEPQTHSPLSLLCSQSLLPSPGSSAGGVGWLAGRTQPAAGPVTARRMEAPIR